MTAYNDLGASCQTPLRKSVVRRWCLAFDVGNSACDPRRLGVGPRLYVTPRAGDDTLTLRILPPSTTTVTSLRTRASWHIARIYSPIMRPFPQPRSLRTMRPASIPTSRIRTFTSLISRFSATWAGRRAGGVAFTENYQRRSSAERLIRRLPEHNI